MRRIIDKLYKESFLDRLELKYLMENIDTESRKYLYQKAFQKRVETYGNKIYMRALIEFSSFCKQDCLYCGIRKSNEKAGRYRLSSEQIIELCGKAYGLGYRTFVIQGGEDFYFTRERLVNLIERIRKEFPEAAITLSIGERDEQTYRELFRVGADRFLLRHETATRALYERLHPTMSFDNRRNTLRVLNEIGYQIGAGFMVGLPGQGTEEILDDLFFLKELEPDMIGIGPFVPHEDTPLKNQAGGTLEQTLLCLSITRLLVPSALIPSTTATDSIDPQGRLKAFKSGTNVVMLNVTPEESRKKYQLYQNKSDTDISSENVFKRLEEDGKKAGLQIDMGRGDSLKSL